MPGMKKIIYIAALMAAAAALGSCDNNSPERKAGRAAEIGASSYYVYDAEHKNCFLVYVATGTYPSGNMAGAQCTPEVIADARPLIVGR
jgi:hypothetical protein